MVAREHAVNIAIDNSSLTTLTARRLQGAIEEIDTELANVSGGGGSGSYITLEDWHEVGAAGEPAFQNGWNSLAGYGPFAFRIDENTGLVHFKGIIQVSVDPAGNSVIFTLPTTHRPSMDRILTVPIANLTHTFVLVGTNGAVTLITNVTINTTLYFDSLYFAI